MPIFSTKHKLFHFSSVSPISSVRVISTPQPQTILETPHFQTGRNITKREKKNDICTSNLLLVLLFNLLPDLIDLFLNVTAGIRFFRLIMMSQTVPTPPRALGFLLGRRIQTVHMVIPLATATAQQTRRHPRVACNRKITSKTVNVWKC